MRALSRLSVIGAGQMGTGIGIVGVRAGMDVKMLDTTEEALKSSDTFVKK